MFIEVKIENNFPKIKLVSKDDQLLIDPLGAHPQTDQQDSWQLPIHKDDEQQILRWFVNHMEKNNG
jgi:hypothetical protein